LQKDSGQQSGRLETGGFFIPVSNQDVGHSKIKKEKVINFLLL
jgi:hypothetical protein